LQIHLAKLILVLLILTSCRFNGHETIEPPARKADIPKDAFLTGGVDGINWYEVVHVHNHRNSAFIKIFDENRGRLIVSKNFTLLCAGSDNPTWIEDLKSQIIPFSVR
jgi:hypothetical protein